MKSRLLVLIVLVSLLLTTPALGLTPAPDAPAAPPGLRPAVHLRQKEAAQPWPAPERSGPGAVITVNTTDDELNNDGDCSLREAIESANLNAAVDACVAGSGGDTVLAPAGAYVLTLVGAMEDANQTGDLDILDNLALTGDGANVTILDGFDSDRVLDIHPGRTVEVNAVTVTHGYLVDEDGGGIFSQGFLTVNDAVITENWVESYWWGGALAQDAFVGDVSAAINRSVVSYNTGGIPGGLGNTVGMDNGTATMVVSQSVISHNTAATWGGGLYNGFWLGYVDGLATLTVIDSVVENNDGGPGGGGGIYGADYPPDNQLGSVTVIRSAIRGNTTGGGIDGMATGGGGIFSQLSEFTVDASTISDNLASGDGIEMSGWGGGILLLGGAATISNSTISGNQALGPGLPVRSGLGGGIEHTTAGVYPEVSTLTLTNTTIVDNYASVAGGGLDIGPSADGTAGTTFKNVIIAGNSAPAGFGESCSRLDWGYGLGDLTSLGHNLEDEDLCNLDQPTDLPNSDPLLAPLADNGGPTLTHLPASSSLAIDGGDDAACPAIDQRGVARPLDGNDDGEARCDIGAVEAAWTPPALSIADAAVLEGDSGDTWLVFTVSLSAQSYLSATVTFATTDDTAQAGSDYSAISGTLLIPALETTGLITVTVHGDTPVEPDETLSLTLSGPIHASLLDAQAVGTIQNDDVTLFTIFLPLVVRNQVP